MTVVGNPWRPYGLRADPFFQEPLTADPDSLHPTAGLFVGRDEELRLLGNQVLGSVSSRAVVQGPVGVGKTTLVSQLKAVLSAHGVLTFAQPVRVTGEMTVHEFAAEVLRMLTQVRASQQAESTTTAAESDDATAFWRRVGGQLEGEDVVGGGVSAAGFGVSATGGRIAAERRDLALYPDLERAVRLLTAAPAARGAGHGHEPGRVLVHVNNFENLTREAVRHAAGLVQDLRDYFVIPQTHWIFVGAGDVEQTIFRASEAVSGVVPIVADLAPLSGAEVSRLLERRYERLRAGHRFVAPVDRGEAEALYARYGGDLRNFLRVLSNAVQRTPIAGVPRPLTARAVVQTMAEPYWRSLEQRLGKPDADHLAAVVRGQGPGATFRAADVAERTGLSKGSVAEFLDRLRTKGVLRHGRTVGRNTYYRLHTDAEIAFGLV